MRRHEIRNPLERALTRSTLALVMAGLLVLALGHLMANGSGGGPIIDNLRDGGYNLYFRHVATDWSQSDDLQREGDWLSCDPARMRQLSAAGRADAIAIGHALRHNLAGTPRAIYAELDDGFLPQADTNYS